MSELTDVAIIIRGSHERTEPLLHAVLGEQECHSLDIIHFRPHHRAVKETLLLGQSRGADWTLCLDADVLPFMDGIHALVSFARQQDPGIFEFQGMALDKFIPVLRPAGNHLYRTSLIGQALPLVPEDTTTIRAEYEMLNRMARKMKHPWCQMDAIVGFHDFEQYHLDIFRKCFIHTFIHTFKHAGIAKKLGAVWDMASPDPDYRVAARAAEVAEQHAGEFCVDREFQRDRARDELRRMHVAEKEELRPTGFNDLNRGYVSRMAEARAGIDQQLQKRFFPNRKWNLLRDGRKSPLLKLKKILSITGMRSFRSS